MSLALENNVNLIIFHYLNVFNLQLPLIMKIKIPYILN